MRTQPIRALIHASVFAAAMLALTACNGSSNSPSANPGPTTPPAVDNTFTTFVKSLLATASSDTAAPIDINAHELTFDENASAYNDVLGN